MLPARTLPSPRTHWRYRRRVRRRTLGRSIYAYSYGDPLSGSDPLGLLCRKGERVLRNEFFKSYNHRYELSKIRIPGFGKVEAEFGVAPKLTPEGIEPELGPTITWHLIWNVWEHDKVTEGYLLSRFYSRKWYCDDGPCGKERVELRDDGPPEFQEFYDEHTEWSFRTEPMEGYKTGTP